MFGVARFVAREAGQGVKGWPTARGGTCWYPSGDGIHVLGGCG